jgi:hypothetical protein
MAQTHFLFPSNPLRPGVPDETFADQNDAVVEAGHTASTFSDAAVASGRPLRNMPQGSTVVYRGWMLTPAEYTRWVGMVMASGGVPMTSPDKYVAAHYLPNWYPLIEEFTPETQIMADSPDAESALRSIGWEAYFVKDFVKSLKTARGSIVRDPSELVEVLAEMRRIRGEIEGGICVRRVEKYLPDSERRYFVLRGCAHDSDGSPVPEIVHAVAGRVPLPFFSVDVAVRSDGVLRVVEIGDGQVSDIVGWSPGAFAAIWNR